MVVKKWGIFSYISLSFQLINFVGDNESIQTELKRISNAFDALALDFEKLKGLSEEEFKTSTLKGGPVNGAAINALLILKYICKTSNIDVKPKSSSKSEPSKYGPMLSDYIHFAFINNKIKGRVKSEFDNIKNVRNLGIHPDDEDYLSELYEELSPTKVKLVEEAILYIKKWFFTTYLENAFPESVTKTIEKLSPQKEYKKQEPTPPIENSAATSDQKITSPHRRMQKDANFGLPTMKNAPIFLD